MSPAQTTTVPLQLCPKCLGPGHLRKACTNKVRYRRCFNYGHKSSACLSKARSQRRFRPVIRLEGEAARNTDIYHESTISLDVSASAFPTVHQAQTVENPSSSIAMVNWAVDPLPFVPKGFMVEPVQNPLLCHEMFVTGCYTAYNEDLAIVKLQPWVHKEDFTDLESTLRTFFEEMHQVRVADIQPCPLGDAFVRFNSPLEREKFLGPEFSFGSYSMKVIKHDDGDNARSYDLDRDAWVMILAFPEDLKIGITIAKAISGFGILVDWHDNLAPVVAKVYLNEFAKIPSSVKVNAGLPQKGCSWTLPCYVLKKSNLVSPPNEEAFVTHGPLHPVPPQPPPIGLVLCNLQVMKVPQVHLWLVQ